MFGRFVQPLAVLTGVVPLLSLGADAQILKDQAPAVPHRPQVAAARPERCCQRRQR